MPKFDIFLKPGEELPKELLKFLMEKCSKKTIDKLSKFGGRIQVSVTAPFVDKKGQNKKLIITEEFINKLKIDFVNASVLLQNLTQKQLLEVARKLDFPVKSTTNVNEIRNRLIGFLQSEDKWKRISGG